MKILWLSDKVLSDQDDGSSGTWLQAMADRLSATGQVELGNIAQGAVANLVRQDAGAIQQWIVPRQWLDGRSTNAAALWQTIEGFAPDVIHVWGTETCWGLLTAEERMPFPALLEIQGLRGAIGEVFNGGLSWREQLACSGPKEMILRSFVWSKQHRFRAWEEMDRRIISAHRFIACHSDWAVARVRAVNRTARIFRNERVLRSQFYGQARWRFSGRPVIFCSAAYPSPFKGLHVAIRALALIKQSFPDVELRIAGAHQWPGLHQEGYIAWLGREIRRLSLERNVVWLGALSGAQIARELSNCSACVLPTFMESYCVALAEAMALGVPTAVSFNGGTAYLAADNETALFFPAGDERMCAYQLERLLADAELAEGISRAARRIGAERNDPRRISQTQLQIYRSVMADAPGAASEPELQMAMPGLSSGLKSQAVPSSAEHTN
jgi:glycosyltransferase involved in cell wall biosynthesis